MTSPEDDLEKALRQALADAMSQVEPGADGLERIRARIGDRKPRPWLVSVVAAAVSWALNWTWRGHWAWHVHWAGPRLRRLPAAHRIAPQRPAAVSWLRPVVVLAGVAVIASISLGVQPFRHAIIQASNTVLTGGSQPTGGGSTDGDGTPVGTESGTSQPAVAARGTASRGDRPGAATESGSASPVATPTLKCLPSNVADIPSALPHYSSTPAPSCTATATPAATPTATPTGASVSSPTVSPSGSSPTATATGTATASPTSTASPTGSPSSSPTASTGDSSPGTGDASATPGSGGTGGTGDSPAGTASPSPTPGA